MSADVTPPSAAAPALERHQRLANRAALLAIGSALVFLAVALIGNWEGMAGLGLALLLYFVALLHVPLGIVALLSAWRTRRHLTNSWIYAYFTACSVAAIVFFGRMYEWEAALEGVFEQVADPATAQLRDAVAGVQLDRAAALAAIEAGAEVDTVDRRGRTPLMVAADAGDLGLTRVLLEAGASVAPAPTSGGDTALHYAAAGGGHRHAAPQPVSVDVDVVRLLLEAGADPSARGHDDQTPLLAACAAGAFEAFELLRAAGADVQAQARGGDGCVELAVEAGRIDFLARLLQDGIDPHLAGRGLVTAVQRARPEPFRLLLEGGADPSPLMGERTSLVMRFFGSAQDERAAAYARMYQALLDSGRGARAFAQGGFRELQQSLGQAPDVLDRLLALGLRADVRDDRGTTLLHSVVTRTAGPDAALQVQRLVQAGAPVDGADHDGRTALQAAAREGHLEALQALLDAGADMQLRDDQDRDALRIAARAGFGYIIDAMAAAGLPTPPASRHGDLLIAAREHGTSMAALLRLGLDPDAVDDRGVRPLLDSVAYGDPEAVAALLAAGADPDVRSSGYSPLTLAASRDRDAAIRALIAAGVDPDQADDRGRRPLEVAIKGHYILSCMALIEGGARLTASDREQILDEVLNPDSRMRGGDQQEALRALL